MVQHWKVRNLIQDALAAYLAEGLDDARYEFEHNKDLDFAYVNHNISERTQSLNSQEFEMFVDNQRFVVTVTRPRSAA